MLKIEHMPAGPLGVNCALAWDPVSNVGVVVDPGGHAARIMAKVASLGFQVEALLLTHAHFDHIGAASELQQHWSVPAYLHPEDRSILGQLHLQLAAFNMPFFEAPATTDLQDGQTLYGLTVLHTPGHSPGGCCFFGQGAERPVLIAGDTLFAGGVGRTDLWGGSWEQLETSIQTRLYTLPDDTHVIPGHGPDTTLGEEARNNPYIRRKASGAPRSSSK